MTTFLDPRQALAAISIALLAAAGIARADDVQDASRLLKAGQHQQDGRIGLDEQDPGIDQPEDPRRADAGDVVHQCQPGKKIGDQQRSRQPDARHAQHPRYEGGNQRHG